VQARLVFTEDAARRDDAVSFRARRWLSRGLTTRVAWTGGVAVSVGGTVDDETLRRWSAGSEVTAPVLVSPAGARTSTTAYPTRRTHGPCAASRFSRR
jgi:hypothetical protein